jgi:hypothetical protein
MANKIDPDDFITISKAAAILDRSVQQVYTYINQGKLEKRTLWGRTLLEKKKVRELKTALGGDAA